MELFVQIASKYGLFVALVVYVLYENKQRENRYLQIIETLSEEVKERLVKLESIFHSKRNDSK